MNALPPGLTLTCNWVAERRRTSYGISYYSQLVLDCIDQVNAVGVAYCFTAQQADDIQRRVRRHTVREVTDVGFIIRIQ